MSGLSQYDSIVFKGRLAGYSSIGPGVGYHFLIKEAELIKIEKARVLMSIDDYEFRTRKSTLTKTYEFFDFQVVLSNDGKLPLRDAFLEINIEHMKGIQRHIYVGPQESRKITMWQFSEWIVNGEKRMMGFDIPPGSYEGVIRLRDASGRLIASKSFSHYLPPFERKSFPWDK